MGKVLDKVLDFLRTPEWPLITPSSDSLPPGDPTPESPRPKGGGKQSARELAKVLSAMHEYLVRSNHGFHIQCSMIYCNSCKSIGLSGGDYNAFEGNDCFGAHYKRVSHPETCHLCESNDFVRISPRDILALESKDPADILVGIEKGLLRMDFPCLYNERLPSAASRWKDLSEDEKLAQVASMLKINQDIVEAREKVRELEASLKD